MAESKRKKAKRPVRRPALKTLLELSKKYAGCKTDMAAALGCTRQALYNWEEVYPDFKKANESHNDVLVDLAIEGLKYHLEKKSEKTIQYTLDRLAKNRGFGHLIQITDKSKIDDQLDQMTDDEIISEIEKSRKRIKGGA